MRISYHAIERFQERTGCKSEVRARQTLQRMAANAEKAFGYKYRGKTEMLTGIHFKFNGWVLVIIDETVVTCFTAGKEQCL